MKALQTLSVLVVLVLFQACKKEPPLHCNAMHFFYHPYTSSVYIDSVHLYMVRTDVPNGQVVDIMFRDTSASFSWRQLLFGNEGWEMLHEKGQVEYSMDEMDVYRMLGCLNERSKETLVLFELSGFSIKEISEIQGSSLSGVKSRLVRARHALEKMGMQEKNVVSLIG